MKYIKLFEDVHSGYERVSCVDDLPEKIKFDKREVDLLSKLGFHMNFPVSS